MSDRITETIAVALATRDGYLYGLDSLSPNGRDRYREDSASLVAALKANRITLTQLPEPTAATEATDDVNGYAEWDYPHGSIATTDDGTIMWGRWHITNPEKVRAAAAALLAAADAAETPSASYCLGCGGNFPHGHQCKRKA